MTTEAGRASDVEPGEDHVPEAESAELKEVYAFFGLAAYMGQVLEKSFVTFLAILRSEGVLITRAQYIAISDYLDTRTLGQLLREAKSAIAIPAADAALLEEALRLRNHLVHQFFADHAPASMTEPGRALMIEDLRIRTATFQRAEATMVRLSEPTLLKYGLTPERAEAAGAELVALFLAGLSGK
jgi:hypothetical protein